MTDSERMVEDLKEMRRHAGRGADLSVSMGKVHQAKHQPGGGACGPCGWTLAAMMAYFDDMPLSFSRMCNDEPSQNRCAPLMAAGSAQAILVIDRALAGHLAAEESQRETERKIQELGPLPIFEPPPSIWAPVAPDVTSEEILTALCGEPPPEVIEASPPTPFRLWKEDLQFKAAEWLSGFVRSYDEVVDRVLGRHRYGARGARLRSILFPKSYFLYRLALDTKARIQGVWKYRYRIMKRSIRTGESYSVARAALQAEYDKKLESIRLAAGIRSAA